MRPIVALMATVAALVNWCAATALAAQPIAPPPACETPEHRQFDFWVGRWSVYRSETNELVANSLIEKLYGGCAIRENWLPVNGFGAGGSLNSYRPNEKRWRQVYTGAGNGWSEYIGGIDGSAMVFVGNLTMPDGSQLPVRMTFMRSTNGAVLQIGERSSDGGKTWQPDYHFTYRPTQAR